MEVVGNLDFKGIGKLVRPGIFATDFPANPTIGELVLKDKKLLICVDVVAGLPYWVNLVNDLSLFRYDQATPAMAWTIVHGLNTNLALVQVYDNAGNQIIPDNIDCSVLNQTTVSFNTPTAGAAIISSGNTLGLPQQNSAYTNTYTNLAVWVVNHSLGFNPSITCIVNDYIVQPDSIVYNSLSQATVTFSSPQTGSVRCV